MTVDIKNFKDKDLSNLTDEEIKKLEEEERKDNNKKLVEDDRKKNPPKPGDDDFEEDEENDEGNENEEGDEDEEELDDEGNPIKKEVTPPAIDWQKKFVESQKESMVLSKQIEELTIKEVPHVEVDDKHMTEIYGEDWETMTNHEKIMAKEIEINKQEKIEERAKRELENKKNELGQKWTDSVNDFVDTDMISFYPEMKGKEEEFKKFATKPTRRGLAFDDLVKIFKADNPNKIIKTKRNLFNAPGGPGKKITPEKMSVDDIRRLRLTNPRKYNEMVVAGKIKIDL